MKSACRRSHRSINTVLSEAGYLDDGFVTVDIVPRDVVSRRIAVGVFVNSFVYMP